MTNFTARIAGVATLALACVPALALTTAAHAASHVPAAVRISDLNLATPDGRVQFSQRADAAAHRYCANEAALDQKSACEAGVRAEVNEKVQASRI